MRLPPKSGDITRCVSVVSTLWIISGFPQFVWIINNALLIRQWFDNARHLKMLNLVKLAFVLTFIVSLGTNLFTNKLWWKHAGRESIRLFKRLIRKAVRLEDSLFILAYISPFNNWLKHLQLIEAKQRINNHNLSTMLFLSWSFFRNLADPNPLIRGCWSARLRTTIKIGLYHNLTTLRSAIKAKNK